MPMRTGLAPLLVLFFAPTLWALTIRHDALDIRSDRPLATRSLYDTSYLPAQIGGIAGAYGLSLVVVAFLIILLSKRRREHLDAAEFDHWPEREILPLPATLQLQDSVVPYAVKTPVHTSFQAQLPHSKNPFIAPPPPLSTCKTLGSNPFVDPEIVSADREMAQSQLEEMYKYVMEQEAAKAAGIVLEAPPPPLSPVYKHGGHGGGGNSMSSGRSSTSTAATAADPRQHRKMPSNVSTATTATTATLLRKDKDKSKGKPQGLTLDLAPDETRKSRTSSILSALKSPRSKKKMQGVSISSPLMTPQSGTFPRFHPGAYYSGLDGEEMAAIPPRHYAPAAPPPVPPLPANLVAVTAAVAASQEADGANSTLPTPDASPLSTLSIDERLGASIVPTATTTASKTTLPTLHTRQPSLATLATQADPDSAISQESSMPLVHAAGPAGGLPTSPKPGVSRFPSQVSLPPTPRGATFQQSYAAAPSLPPTPRATNFAQPPSLSRSHAPPSAVRTGGALPLRAYEPSITSPSFATHAQTKQTVFERTMMPPTPGAHTPWTGAPVPYSPYQPFSPVVPITPSLVTKADRKRMRRLEPKTPTMEMVRSIDETW